MPWSTACPDWADRLRSGRSLVPDLPLDRARADRAVAIFDHLRLPDVVGQPLMRDAAGNWQRDMVRAVFGSFDGDTRKIREFFTLVPKKNSKTTCGAAIMATALMVNRRPNAEFLLVAPTLDVTALAFRQAVGMIEADEVLKAKFHIQEHVRKITFRPTGAFLQVKSFDPTIVTGVKPAGALLDETHVIGACSYADRVIGQLRGGMISQPEAFFIQITTQSERPPEGMFAAELVKARNVRDGKLDLPLLALLYEFPDRTDWEDSANWPMVLPNLGKSIHLPRLIEEKEAAKAAGDAEWRRWASQHLNVQIGQALAVDHWPGAAVWPRAAESGLTLESLLARSEVVTIGIDGGGLDDLLALCVLGRERYTRRWLAWGRAWAAPVALERRKQERTVYDALIEQGDLAIVANLPDDVAAVIDVVKQVDATGLLHAVGMDQLGIGGLVDALAEIEITAPERVIGISQGYKLSGAIATTERKLADGTLVHGGQKLMAWAVSNAKIEPRGNAVMITKAASGRAKIDPLMALFDAVALMERNPEARGKSFWETEFEDLVPA